MNDTTTSRYLTTIVAIFMAATLVIGTGTLAATTNNAFAYQKKGPQDNGNDDNSNGNLVTIQKCKQDGTQGGTQCNAIEM